MAHFVLTLGAATSAADAPARPGGWTVMAALLALSALLGIPALAWTSTDLPLPLPPFMRTITVVTTAAAAYAAYAIWMRKRWAPEAYLAWMATNLGCAAYAMFSLLPPLMRMVAAQMDLEGDAPAFPSPLVLGALAFHGLLLSLGYWYLQRGRPALRADAGGSAP